MRLAVRWLRLAVLVLLVKSAAWAVEPPELLVDAPPALAGRATEIAGYDRARLAAAMELAGLSRPGRPIRVLIRSEDSPEARRVPSWVAGYAVAGRDAVVLFPQRNPSYPDRSLDALLRHEVAHILIARAAGGRPVPRWFNEGVAMAASRSWGLEDRARFAIEALTGEQVPLPWLDGWFRGDRSRVRRAYAVSGAFVRDLIRRHGRGVTGRILADVRRGLTFEEAFRRATGMSLAAAETLFWRYQGGWRRWVPFLTSSLAIWLAVTALALLAGWRRRLKTRRLEARWEAEEWGMEGGGPPLEEERDELVH